MHAFWGSSYVGTTPAGLADGLARLNPRYVTGR